MDGWTDIYAGVYFPCGRRLRPRRDSNGQITYPLRAMIITPQSSVQPAKTHSQKEGLSGSFGFLLGQATRCGKPQDT